MLWLVQIIVQTLLAVFATIADIGLTCVSPVWGSCLTKADNGAQYNRQPAAEIPQQYDLPLR